MDQSTAVFLDAVERLSDDDFSRPSALTGWTIGAIVAHVHFNAEAIRRLLHWAHTGIETPMYASREDRNAEIEAGSKKPPTALRALVLQSARDLSADAKQLTENEWAALVVTAMGRSVPASETLWMRTREVAVHAVDLGVGLTFNDIPAGATLRLATEIVTSRHAAGEGPALVGWLTGRTDAPALRSWL